LDNETRISLLNKVGKAQGRGIFLITNLNQISQWKNAIKTLDGQGPELYVAQRYVMNPLLIGGKKFDLRIYALVSNYSPLTVYLYRTGFARFTHHKFSTNLEDVGNNYIHLTNVAVQKNSDHYDEKTGGKWDLRSLKLYLMSK
jgi:tubulin polyglutamylase TTLL9